MIDPGTEVSVGGGVSTLTVMVVVVDAQATGVDRWEQNTGKKKGFQYHGTAAGPRCYYHYYHHTSHHYKQCCSSNNSSDS